MRGQKVCTFARVGHDVEELHWLAIAGQELPTPATGDLGRERRWLGSVTLKGRNQIKLPEDGLAVDHLNRSRQERQQVPPVISFPGRQCDPGRGATGRQEVVGVTEHVGRKAWRNPSWPARDEGDPDASLVKV